MDYFEYNSDIADELRAVYEQFRAYEEVTRQQGAAGEYPAYGELAEATPCSTPVGDPPTRSRLLPQVTDLGRPVRIVCLGPSFEVGGVGQQTLSLARSFDPRRAQIIRCLVTRGDAEGHRRLVRQGIPVDRATPSRMERAANEADVLLLWGDHFDRALPKRRPVCVFVAHGESAWTRQGLERSRAVVDHVIAVSERVRARVCQGFETTTILNGIDTSRLAATRPRQAVRRSFGIRSDEFVLGCVGRMSREKRMDMLIDAVALLPRSCKLLLVGNGTRRAELLERANDLLPGRFVIVSRDDDLGDLYRAMDAFALASAHEGFGLVVAEAMACKRPVIATCVGAVPEILEHDISGQIVEGTPRAIADSVLRLRKYPHWGAGMARQAYGYAMRRLNARRMARKYEDLLTGLVAARASRRQA